MNKPQLHDYFLSIVNACTKSQKFFDSLKACGISSVKWPTSDAKSLMGDLTFLAEKDGYAVASAEIALRIPTIRNLLSLQDLRSGTLDEFRSTHDLYSKIGRAHELAEKIFENPLDVDQFVAEFKAAHKETKVNTLHQALIETVKERQALMDSKTSLVEINGWPLLSNFIGGFNPGRITIISGGTGFGKTTLALNLALKAIETIPALFVNMEMLQYDLIAKIICSEVGISYRQFQKDYLSDYTQQKIIDLIKRAGGIHPLTFTDGRSLTLQDLTSLIIQQKEQNGIGLVFIDYDQKIAVQNRSEEWKLLQIAVEELEEIAKITRTHIILLSQADEAGDPKASKRIKQSASCVLHFTKALDNNFYLIPIKNRFGGSNEAIQAEFDSQVGRVKEIAITPKPEQSGKRNSLPNPGSARVGPMF